MKPSTDFIRWIRSDAGKRLPHPQYRDWVDALTGKRRQGMSDPERAFSEEICANLKNGSWNSVTINQVSKQYRSGVLDEVDSFHSLDLNEGAFKIIGKRIRNLNIGGVDTVSLHNCWINNFNCGSSNPTVEIVDCWIGRLHLTNSSASRFRMLRGGFLDIVCPSSEKNAFTGPVDLVDLFLPRRRGYGLESAQPYRNLRACLVALHNMPAAAAIHSAELAFERQDEAWLTKQLSYAYDAFSDYGGSVGRPLLWLALWMLGSAGLILATDGALPAEEYAHTPAGWRTGLFGTDVSAQVTRAVVYTLNSIVNPLGIFGRQLLVARETWIAAATSGLCLLGTISLALFLLALRRRFKLQ